MNTAGVLLAAGASRRYGNDDKLLAPLLGRLLIDYSADAMRGASLDILIAVVANENVAARLEGFHLVWGSEKTGDFLLSDSIKAGISRARSLGADRALIALGDMPGVTCGLLSRVVQRCSMDMPSATSAGAGPMVPACFPRRFFPELMNVEGDTGARSLLLNIPDEAVVGASAAELCDFDTRDDFPGKSDCGRSV